MTLHYIHVRRSTCTNGGCQERATSNDIVARPGDVLASSSVLTQSISSLSLLINGLREELKGERGKEEERKRVRQRQSQRQRQRDRGRERQSTNEIEKRQRQRETEHERDREEIEIEKRDREER